MLRDPDFRWIDWNIDHIAEHGIETEEAESVVRNARAPYPRQVGDERFLVIGRGSGGRWVQVAFVLDPDDTVFVIHARPLTEQEKSRSRRQGRKRGRNE